jgi:5-(carboxyamino)imidazole ribonucleotide synthase
VMREAMDRLDAPQPRWAVVSSAEDVEAFGLPCVLKVTRGGYDGKGVWVARTSADVHEPLATAQRSGVRLLAEELVDFRRELSAVVARSPSGEAVAYPVVATTQLDGICHEVVAPAPGLAPDRAAEAQALARRIATELDVTGILAVELFEAGDRILINELAMRPHNTGHWTQDGAVTSQFENHLRGVLDLPMGSAEARAPWTVMVNILGGLDPEAGHLYDGYQHAFARDPRLRVHLYGKDLRPGRKVGHVNVYGDDLEDCLARARHAAGWFRGDVGDDAR